MAVNWKKPTQAKENADNGLKIIDGLMTYASDDRGRPSWQEGSLYLSAITFAYAVWENFVEEIAIEFARRLADPEDGLEPRQMSRPAPRALIENDASTWDLSVYPGWRELWVQRIREQAVGGDSGGFGINNADSKNTRRLFNGIGINPFPDEQAEGLDRLVGIRGEIVHTARTKSTIYKAEVGEWQRFVQTLCETVDTQGRIQCLRWLHE